MSALLSKPMIYLGLLLAILLAVVWIMRLAGCESARQKARADRREERSQRVDEFEVKEVTSGCQLTLAAGRRGRTRDCILSGIEIPPEAAAASKQNLERLVAGGKVTVHYEHHGILGATEGEPAAEARENEMEASGPIIATLAFGDGGLNLQTGQLFAGLARCSADASDIFKAAEKVAKRNQVGIWKRGRPNQMSDGEFEELKDDLRKNAKHP